MKDYIDKISFSGIVARNQRQFLETVRDKMIDGWVSWLRDSGVKYNKHGHGSWFYGNIAKNIKSRIDYDAGTVLVYIDTTTKWGQMAHHKVFGGVVRPKSSKFLAIPITAAAMMKGGSTPLSARNLIGNGKVSYRKYRGNIVMVAEGTPYAWALKKSVRNSSHVRNVLPTKEYYEAILKPIVAGRE